MGVAVCNKQSCILEEIYNALALSSRVHDRLIHQIFLSLLPGLRILMLSSQIMGFETFDSIMYMRRFKTEKTKLPYNIPSSENSTNLRFLKPNLDAITWRQHDPTFDLRSVVIPVLAYALKTLQNPNNCITYESHQPTALFMDYEKELTSTYPSQSMQIVVRRRSSVRR